MATVGSWGNSIVFSTSDYRILTFKDFSRNVSGEWATHGRIGGKDRVEFVKPGLQKISFKMELNIMHGVKPRTVLDQLASAVERGEINPMVIGGKRVGRNRWRITATSEAWDTVYYRGELVEASVTVTMEEYL